MGFGNFGIWEMLVIGVFVLIFFGPRRMPEIARSLGKAMREFKKGVNEIQRELEVADRDTRQATRTAWQPPSAPRPEAADSAADPGVPPDDLSIQPPPAPDYPTTTPAGDGGTGADVDSVVTEPVPVKRPPLRDVESESAIEGLYMGGPPGGEPASETSEASPPGDEAPAAGTPEPEDDPGADDSQADLFRSD